MQIARTKAPATPSPIRITGAMAVRVRASGRVARLSALYGSDHPGTGRNYEAHASIAISGDGWPDDVRLSDIEAQFVCHACGHRDAGVRPDFNWNKTLLKA
jgi:hypothetical protein